MANWIKYLKDLPQDPAVILISERTRLIGDAVCGKLMRLWAWADTNTVDGFVPNISQAWVDKFVGKTGFAAAMVDAKWLELKQDGVVFIHFDRHNGNSAKKRADDAERQRLSRSNRDKVVTNVTDLSQNSVTNVTNSCDKSVTRAEQSRADKKKTKDKGSESVGCGPKAESNSQGQQPACLPATVREALERLRIGEPALSQLADSPRLSVPHVMAAWDEAQQGNPRDPRRVLVHALCRMAGVTLPRKRGSLGNSLASDPAVQKLLAIQASRRGVAS